MILLIGGSRSGKSDFAVELAKEIAGPQGNVAFLLPFALEEFAPEVRARAEHQQSARPKDWLHFEPPYDFGLIAGLWQRREIRALIFDSLSLWMAHELTLKSTQYNASLLATHCSKESEYLVSGLLQIGVPTVLVSAEVNAGVSPDHESGRLYRDLVAGLNLGLAKQAKLVLQLQCGIATALKYPVHWSLGFKVEGAGVQKSAGQRVQNDAFGPTLIVQPACAKDVF